MDNDLRKSYLELKVIWKDADMIELKVKASNSRFSGTTEVYENPEYLYDLSNKLLGFPTEHKTIFYEAGQKNNYGYFSMNFYCIDNIGHIGVEINIEENVPTYHRKEEKDKLKLEIIVVPSGIDNFQKELLNLAKREVGSAILYGQYSNPDNTLI
jgi:hypothetical protein